MCDICPFRDNDLALNLLRVGKRCVGGIGQRAVNDQRLRLRRVQLVGDLAFAITGVDGRDGCASFEDAEEGDFEFGAVGGEHPHDVALAYAHSRKGGGKLVRVRVELGEREPAVAVDDGGLGRPSFGGALEQALERLRVVGGDGGSAHGSAYLRDTSGRGEGIRPPRKWSTDRELNRRRGGLC